jgi:hypothetical protein
LKDLARHDPASGPPLPAERRRNLEQMFEHAIVHVLRHRRQVERFLR